MEEWNEYGEIEEQLGSSGPAPATSTVPSTLNTPSKPPPTKAPTISTSEASARMSEAATTPAESTKQQNLAETPPNLLLAESVLHLHLQCGKLAWKLLKKPKATKANR